jgi:hypothetical protein
MGEKNYTFRVLVGKPVGKNHFQRPECDGIMICKIGTRAIGWEDIN